MAVPKEKKITAGEFFEMIPETNDPYELIKGDIHMQAMPNIKHQLIGSELYNIFSSFIRKNNGKCKALPPIDVVLDENNVVIPDFLVVCDTSKLDDKRCYGAPDFVIEIASSNAENDYFIKTQLYKLSGVREYWIVDQRYEKTLVYRFEVQDMPEIYPFDKPIPVNIYNGELEINISEIINYIK